MLRRLRHYFLIVSFLISFAIVSRQAKHGDSDQVDEGGCNLNTIDLLLDSSLSPPNRTDAEHQLAELRAKNSTNAAEVYLDERKERLLTNSLKLYNVPVDRFMLGDIRVSVVKKGTKEVVNSGACSTLEIWATSVVAGGGVDKWANSGGRLCSYKVCLSALVSDCSFKGGEKTCNISDEHPSGFVIVTAASGIALFSFLAHMNYPDVNGRQLMFHAGSDPHHSNVSVLSNEIIVSNKGSHLEFTQSTLDTFPSQIPSNTPLPPIELVMMYSDPYDGGKMKVCSKASCGNDAEVNVDVTVPRILNGVFLKNFSSIRLESTKVRLGGTRVKTQVITEDLSIREQAHEGRVNFTDIRLIDLYNGMKLNFTASQDTFFHTRVPNVYKPENSSSTLFSPTFNVTPQEMTRLRIADETNPTPSTIVDANFPFPVPIKVHICDVNGNKVTSGSDAFVAIHISASPPACLTANVINATEGVAVFVDSVCEEGLFQLNFTVYSRTGSVYSILSNFFEVKKEIKIGLLAPQPGVWDFFGSAFSTMVTLALEDVNDPDKFKTIFKGKKGQRKLSFVVGHTPSASETVNVAPEVGAIRSIMDLISKDRIQLLLGPTQNLDFDSMAMMPGVFNVTQIGLFPQGERFTYQQRYPFLTLLSYSFDRFGEALAHYCATHYWKRVAVIWNSKLPVPRSFRREAALLNVSIVADEYIEGVDSVPNVPNLQEVKKTLKSLPDYKSHFDRIKKENVDAILSFPFSQDSWHLYKQAILHEIAPYHGYQWVAAGTLSAMSFPTEDFYSCSVPENVTCAVGFAGMVQVVQYLLRDIQQFEDWEALEKRVNMLDPTVYDTTIRYPRRFTFLLLGLVYDAVIIYMRAVSDLINENRTLTARTITEAIRPSGEGGIFGLSFENGDRAGYRGVEVNLKYIKDEQNKTELSYELNFSFELDLDNPKCLQDKAKCRGLNYNYLNVSHSIEREWWATPLKTEKRLFKSKDAIRLDTIFGMNSIPVTFGCQSGCGGGLAPRDEKVIWAPGVCAEFKALKERNIKLKKHFFEEATLFLNSAVVQFYTAIFTDLGRRDRVPPECNNPLSAECGEKIQGTFPVTFAPTNADPTKFTACQLLLGLTDVGRKNLNGIKEPDPVCLYNAAMCGLLGQRCALFNASFDQNNSIYETCDFRAPGLLEACHAIQLVPELGGAVNCFGVNVTTAMCTALVFHDIDCTEDPATLDYMNGRCVAPDDCQCKEDPHRPGEKGWEGTDCSKPICVGNCNGNGVCVAPSTCECYPGYFTNSGDQCNELNCSDVRLQTVKAEEDQKMAMGPNNGCSENGDCVVKNPSGFTFSVVFLNRTTNFSHRLSCDCKDGFSGFRCDDETGTFIAILVPTLVVCVIVAALIAVVQYKVRRMRIQDQLASTDWRVKYEELYFQPDRKPFGWTGRRSPSESGVSTRTASTLRVGSVASPLPECAVYKGQMIAVKRVRKPSVKLTEEIVAEIRFLRGLRHVNLIPFIGVCIDFPNIAFLTEYTSKGSLRDVLGNDDIRLDWGFRYSLARDLAQGMEFLHHSDMRWHGRLTSSNCLIDSHWVLKVTDFGLHYFKQGSLAADENLELQKLLWVAPELLVVSEPHSMPVESLFVGIDASKLALVCRTHYISRLPGGTKKADVFGFGMILYELLSRQLPFYDCEMSLKLVIAHMQRDPEFRPALPDACPAKYGDVMESCWADCPEDRPSFTDILAAIKREHDPGTLVDNMVLMLEKYSSDLEELVEERTKALAEEKARSETILYQMIPKKVAQQLKAGNKIAAEQFEEVTVCFCDIVGFTKIAANSTPLQVIGLLNDLYSRFDKVIDSYNVFKLGTIGDAYIVVSGLPERTGPNHAPEIANTALDLMASINGFTIKHFPDLHLQLRIGLHSGPCVAGVVGLKVPHYCVFGDTVNIASRMESTGFSLRIHLSSTTTRILRRIGGYHIETRGKINLKGKGPMVTSWLLGRDGFDKELPPWDKAIPEEHHDFKGIENMKAN